MCDIFAFFENVLFFFVVHFDSNVIFLNFVLYIEIEITLATIRNLFSYFNNTKNSQMIYYGEFNVRKQLLTLYNAFA